MVMQGITVPWSKKISNVQYQKERFKLPKPFDPNQM
jgi:hypothetical protein